MGAGRGHSRVEAGVGDAEHADAAVVAGDIFDHPVDGVVGIAGLVDIFIGLLVFVEGADVFECTFAHPAAADVLANYYVAFAQIVAQIAGEKISPIVLAIGGAGVGRAGQEDGMFLRGIFRRIDGGEQFDAVSHGDGDLGLEIVIADPAAVLSRTLAINEMYAHGKKR